MCVEGTGRLWEVGNIYYGNKRPMSFVDFESVSPSGRPLQSVSWAFLSLSWSPSLPDFP